MRTEKTFRVIAGLVGAYRNCLADAAKQDWAAEHRQRLEDIARNVLPSGSGIDSGTKLDIDASTADKLVFNAGYHHMNDGGYYDGWTEHQIIVRPSLAHELDIRITGRNRNDIKDYLHDTYHYALTRTLAWDVESRQYKEQAS